MKLERSFSFDLTDWQRETLKENFNFNAEEEIYNTSVRSTQERVTIRQITF